MESENAEVYYSDNPSEVEGANRCFESDDSEDVPNPLPTSGLRSGTTSLLTENDDEEDEDYDYNEDSREEETEEETDEEDGDEEAMDDDTPAPSKQKTIMKLLENDQPRLNEGDLWYLIDIGWFRRWKQFVKYDWSCGGLVSRPGPITNEGLLEPDTDRVKRNLIEHTHFAIISKREWEHLLSWYGGGPEIARPVISTSTFNKTVEVRKLDLHFLKSSSTEPITHEFSKVCTVKEMKEIMCPILEVEADNVRIWDYHNKQRSQLLENPDKTLSEYTIIHNQYILFEEKQENGEWAPAPQRQTYSYASGVTSWSGNNSYYGGGYQNRGKEPTDPGLCGLSNLGNTCFMNSSLQCLSNSTLLTDFFLSGKYKRDINTVNPLGTGGKLVEQYATLLRDMWSGEYKYIAPREFKHKLETFAPQFQGMQQHDSQELLGYLLDGLHEDLNRVKQKPYIELKEADGRPDTIVAEEAWNNHLARNDSVIVDWYQGQLKSKLTCPDCDRVSVTFDPCMYLSLPLPVENTRNLKVIVNLEDPLSLPIERTITVPKTGCISDLKTVISELYQIPAENFVVVEIWNHKIYKVFLATESIEKIQERDDVRVYYVSSPEKRALQEDDEDDEDKEETSKPMGNQGYYNYNYSYGPTYKPIVEHPEDVIHVQVILRKKERSTYYANSRIQESWGPFGIPMVIAVPRNILYEDLHNLIAAKLARFFEDPSVLEFPSESSFDDTQPMGDLYEENNLDDSSTQLESPRNNPVEETNPPPEEKDAGLAEEDENHATAERENNLDAEEPENDSDDERDNHPSRANHSDNEDEEASDDEAEKSELYPSFFLEIIGSANGRARALEYGRPVNFTGKEGLSVSFTDDLVAQYRHSEEARIERESVETPEEDEDDSIHISECLELYTSEEQLGPDDPWYCNKCQDFKQATKKFDFWKFPPLLVIHLKRFSYRNRYSRDKIDTVVRFPLTDLDLSSYALHPTDVPPIYDLVAVSNHFGALGGGHYTAFAKNHNDKKWYKFDDSNVAPITDESKICSSAAYVLFYRRKDVAVDHITELKYTPSEEASENDSEEEQHNGVVRRDSNEDDSQDDADSNDEDSADQGNVSGNINDAPLGDSQENGELGSEESEKEEQQPADNEETADNEQTADDNV